MNSSHYYDGEWHIYENNHEYTSSEEYTMKTYSNLVTVLGEFSGIEVTRDYSHDGKASTFYSREIGSIVLTIDNYSYSNLDSYNSSYSRKNELIEYHYAYAEPGFNIFGYPDVSLGLVGTSVGILYFILKRKRVK